MVVIRFRLERLKDADCSSINTEWAAINPIRLCERWVKVKHMLGQVQVRTVVPTGPDRTRIEQEWFSNEWSAVEWHSSGVKMGASRLFKSEQRRKHTKGTQRVSEGTKFRLGRAGIGKGIESTGIRNPIGGLRIGGNQPKVKHVGLRSWGRVGRSFRRSVLFRLGRGH